jgi:predicted exporter/SAM-dependent methyltransferase
MRSLPLNWRFLILTLAVTLGLFGWGLSRLEVDTDILGALPKTNPVVADGTYLLLHHPMQNQVVVDIALNAVDLDTLVACGRLVESRLRESGLFKSVGMEDAQALMPELIDHFAADLPVLFSAEQLQAEVAPLLEPGAIRGRVAEIHAGLLGLEGIGQQALIARDPLSLGGLVLKRLAPLVPAGSGRIARGHLISADNRHLLVVANPAESSTATEFAARIMERIDAIAAELNRLHGPAGGSVTVTAAGAFRAALDNQRIIKRDIGLAVTVSTVGIAALLFFSFCRPAVGLFALLPALGGTMLAYFIFSLFHRSISILVLGFGGAIISFSVDQGIAYLLFLDRPQATSGKAASHEVRSMCLLAVLTTVAAFGTLCFSGFPVFVQLGQFTMLGLGLCFLIVHLVFPRIFPVLPPGGGRSLHLQKVVDALGGTGRAGFWGAALFAGVMMFFAKPVFNVSLQAMNTVGVETMAAEKLLTDVWGGMFDKVYVLTEGRTIEELQDQGDRLVARIEADLQAGVLSSGFAPSMIAPGAELRRRNFDAWRAFWSPGRVDALRQALGGAAAAQGFAAEAFAPFYALLGAASPPPEAGARILARFPGFLGIARSPDGAAWVQVSTLVAGPAYDSRRFYDAYAASAKLFDPLFFAQVIGELLFDTAVAFFLISLACALVLVAVFLLDGALTLACMLPPFFAMVATLGTLNLMGRPLDIPGLMLSIVVFGLGIDFSIFYVCSFQRYGTLAHPAFSQIRMAVFLSAATTLLGFGAMWGADHSLLRSTGITAFLGIAYSMLGAFLILPTLLGRVRRNRDKPVARGVSLRDRVRTRYRYMEAYPRLFARFKMRLDPMFRELEEILHSADGVRSILDVGTGYGVPASWLLERFPDAQVRGVEPSAERVRVANMALGARGGVAQGRAPEIPEVETPVDLGTMIDMVHFLTDEAAALTLSRVRARMRAGALLILRASLTPTRRRPWSWWAQNLALRAAGVPAFYRPLPNLAELVAAAGFRVERTLPSGPDGELVWLVGRKA